MLLLLAVGGGSHPMAFEGPGDSSPWLHLLADAEAPLMPHPLRFLNVLTASAVEEEPECSISKAQPEMKDSVVLELSWPVGAK